MRLIDSDALNEKISEAHFKTYGNVMKCIIEAPTVDAVSVVQGRWIFKHNPITDPKAYFVRIVCSECDLHTGQKSNYCPKCGAKMDGGDP